VTTIISRAAHESMRIAMWCINAARESGVASFAAVKG
jgi:hypothetical protein